MKVMRLCGLLWMWGTFSQWHFNKLYYNSLTKNPSFMVNYSDWHNLICCLIMHISTLSLWMSSRTISRINDCYSHFITGLKASGWEKGESSRLLHLYSTSAQGDKWEPLPLAHSQPSGGCHSIYMSDQKNPIHRKCLWMWVPVLKCGEVYLFPRAFLICTL